MALVGLQPCARRTRFRGAGRRRFRRRRHQAEQTHRHRRQAEPDHPFHQAGQHEHAASAQHMERQAGAAFLRQVDCWDAASALTRARAPAETRNDK